MNNNFTAFTVCNVAYLHKALVLADSFYIKTEQKLKIYIVDTKRDLKININSFEIIWIEDLDIPNFKELAFKYDITELSTSLKPYLAILNLKRYEKVMFFDPDICIYSSLSPIIEDLEETSILLTPHYTKPEPNVWSNSDISMLRFGSFNLGFFGLKQSNEADNFLEWWHDRCMRFCFFESQFGLSTDQKWVSIAPCFFDNIKISFNKGYNMAFWNLHERELSLDDNKNLIVNNKYPLIFFHFSNFNDGDYKKLSSRAVLAKESINDSVRYISKLYNKEQNKYCGMINDIFYGFDYMNGGEYISPTLRRAYASIINELENDHNPFDSKGVVGDFAIKNNLFEKSNKSYQSLGFVDKDSYTNRFKITNIILRLILKIYGPNKFMNFSRFLVYLSSYRLNRDLWKFRN